MYVFPFWEAKCKVLWIKCYQRMQNLEINSIPNTLKIKITNLYKIEMYDRL